MTRWVAFAALTLVVLTVVLVSARVSERIVSELAEQPPSEAPAVPDGADHLDILEWRDCGGRNSYRRPSSMAMFANVSFSHGLFATILIAGIWLADVPLSALGVGGGVTGTAAVATGLAIGLAIALVNLFVGSVTDADPSADLRALLTPDSRVGWIVLLAVVLPIIAVFEELLFRAVLIGAFATGFGLSPWLLAVISSVVFAAGHGAQGRIGIVATGGLGLALAVAFVLTESLLVVVVAHYVINAAEFVVVEGIGYEPVAATG